MKRFQLPKNALTLLLLILTLAPADAIAGVSFSVEIGVKTLEQPVDGRLLVFLVGPDRPLEDGESPGEWDFCAQPMPLYAVSLFRAKSGDRFVVDDRSDWYLKKLDELPPGHWVAMAVLDWQNQASGWNMEPGNLSSRMAAFEVKTNKNQSVNLALTEIVREPKMDPSRVEVVNVRSKLLSIFHGRDVYLRAAVVKPISYDVKKSYAAIYEVPGFGGRHFDATGEASRRAGLRGKPESAAKTLAERTFYIVLDPESPNGHTLFADSDVNGPYGKALTEELIPELERRFPLIANTNARIITGHSSGGWATCWLATQYPEVFGAAWPSSPDPIDFRRFELVDIYRDKSFYERDGKELPSTRDKKENVTITLREESTREEIFATENASGQQWDSWQAVWGSNAGRNRPKSLWEPITGLIDRAEVEHYKKYDLSLLMRNDPARYAPIWRERIHLVVGDADDYYLNEAVVMLRDELAKLPPTGNEKSNNGYIKIVPGKTHGSVYDSPEMRAIDQEMLDWLGH